MLEKDAHTNLTLSSAISRHWTMSQAKRAASTPDAPGRRREFSVWAIPWWMGTVCTEACQKEKMDLEL